MGLIELPKRGEIWLVQFGAARSGEPGKTRPAVVVSADDLVVENQTDLVVVVPISSSMAPSQLRPELAQATGLEQPSRAIPRAVRSVAAARLLRHVGEVTPEELAEINFSLALILSLEF